MDAFPEYGFLQVVIPQWRVKNEAIGMAELKKSKQAMDRNEYIYGTMTRKVRENGCRYLEGQCPCHSVTRTGDIAAGGGEVLVSI